MLVNYADAGAKLFFETSGPCASRSDGRVAVELRVLCSESTHQSALIDVSSAPLPSPSFESYMLFFSKYAYDYGKRCRNSRLRNRNDFIVVKYSTIKSCAYLMLEKPHAFQSKTRTRLAILFGPCNIANCLDFKLEQDHQIGDDGRAHLRIRRSNVECLFS